MSDDGHEDFSKPVLPGAARSDYERYLNTDELLALQKTDAEWVHRDELLFQTVHQSSELWLKLAWHEVEEATALADGDDLGGALRLLRRAGLCLQYVTTQLDMPRNLPRSDARSLPALRISFLISWPRSRTPEAHC